MLSLIRYLNDALARLANRVSFRLKNVDCQTDLHNIKGRLRVAGHGRVVISPGVRMNSGPRRNPIGGDTRLTLVMRQNGEIIIGPDCGLSNCTIASSSRVTLGPEVTIGGGVKIYDSDFHHINPDLRRQEAAGSYNGRSRPVEIRRNAFIGAHAIILKGVTIGENSVVGAGSVVSRHIPDNEIWAGNPAVFMRKIKVKAASPEAEQPAD